MSSILSTLIAKFYIEAFSALPFYTSDYINLLPPCSHMNDDMTLSLRKDTVCIKSSCTFISAWELLVNLIHCICLLLQSASISLLYSCLLFLLEHGGCFLIYFCKTPFWGRAVRRKSYEILIKREEKLH